MPVVSDALLERMSRLVVDEVHPDQVILFGSQARGDATPDSDVGLLIIEHDPFEKGRSRHAAMIRLYRALKALGVVKDILAYSRDEVEVWRDSLHHVVARALREGRVLHECRREGTGAQCIRSTSVERRETPIESDTHHAKLLFTVGLRNLDTTRLMQDADHLADETFGFQAQQAAENLIKSWLAVRGVVYPRGHDLGKLQRILSEQDPKASVLSPMAELTPYAVEYRYAESPSRKLDRAEVPRLLEALRHRVSDLVQAD